MPRQRTAQPRLPAALVDAKVHRTDRSPNFGAPSGVPAARRPPRKDRPLTAKKEISAASSNVTMSLALLLRAAELAQTEDRFADSVVPQYTHPTPVRQHPYQRYQQLGHPAATMR